MVREQDGRNTYDIHVDDKLLNVKISDEVIATIAALAATEVEGVAAMSGNVTKDLISKLGMKSLSKGVKIELENEIVEVFLALQVEYGYSIPKISKAVQDKVKTAIETMTGLKVSGVNIRIASVNVDKNA
ncbi:MAG: Asp23/Gls24 family envelope stress response protein [Clostridiales bacterium]|nr:Asp23/Gls24 family envelope stress response protein [Clostridiales bacterium]